MPDLNGKTRLSAQPGTYGALADLVRARAVSSAVRHPEGDAVHAVLDDKALTGAGWAEGRGKAGERSPPALNFPR